MKKNGWHELSMREKDGFLYKCNKKDQGFSGKKKDGERKWRRKRVLEIGIEER